MVLLPGIGASSSVRTAERVPAPQLLLSSLAQTHTAALICDLSQCAGGGGAAEGQASGPVHQLAYWGWRMAAAETTAVTFFSILPFLVWAGVCEVFFFFLLLKTELKI